MVCYHPLKAFPIGKTVKGKLENRITGYDVDHVELIHGKWLEAPSTLVSPYAQKVVKDFIRIPCGRCIGCRLDYSRQWADRCMLEMKYHESSYFVTLTYDDEHMPINDYVDTNTGVCGKVASLRKRDFQLFMKSLRKNYKYDNRLRYFMAGEYGNQTRRPHYHAIIFGLKLDDLVFYKQRNGFTYYNSKFLDDCWDKKGFVVVAKACWETCAYTARYIMKKQKGEESSIYKDYNFEPEFTLMSRKPGIGRKFFDEKGSAIFDTDFVSISTPEGGKNIYPSRYYKKLLEDIDPEKFIKVREKGLATSDNIYYHKCRATSQTYLDMLASEEEVKKNCVGSLKRKDV